jgi:hypothetical protein
MRESDDWAGRAARKALEERQSRIPAGDLQGRSSPPRQRRDVFVGQLEPQPEAPGQILDEGGVVVGLVAPDVMMQMSDAVESDLPVLCQLVQQGKQRR